MKTFPVERHGMRALRRERRALLTASVALVASSAVAPVAAATGPTATLTPDTSLVDGQHATIHASGFPPHTELQVVECAGSKDHLPKDSRECEGSTLDSSGYTDAAGRYLNAPGDPSGDTAGYGISVLPSKTFPVVSVHCGPADPCVLFVGEQVNDFTQPHVFLPFSFKGAKTATTSTSGAGSSNAPLELSGLAVVAAGGLLARRRLRAKKAADRHVATR